MAIKMQMISETHSVKFIIDGERFIRANTNGDVTWTQEDGMVLLKLKDHIEKENLFKDWLQGMYHVGTMSKESGVWEDCSEVEYEEKGGACG